MNANAHKTIVVTGATGFVGRKLTLQLLEKGYDVRVFTRNIQKAKKALPLPVTFYSSLSPSLFKDAHAVIHLAGEPIAERRWSPEVKEAILLSRTKSTKDLIDAINRAENPPQIMIGTSAIGFYGDRGDETLTEDSTPADSYLADVCKQWEAAYEGFIGRKVLLRVGIVLGYGGALEKMLPPFRLGVGGKLASGKQWMSWIHIDDLVREYVFALENNLSGIFNAVAPKPVTNTEFTRELATTLARPAFFPVPAFVIKLLFGEMSTVLLSSQRVSSQKMSDAGFSFRYPSLKLALHELLRPLNLISGYVYEEVKWLPKAPKDVFPFFSEAKNLETITPPWLNFQIVRTSTAEVTEGTLIDYRLKIKGVPARWQTRISKWRPIDCFVDEQLKGPYKTWHHTHTFLPLKNGTLMTDRVVYVMPFGLLGDIVRELIVRNDIRTIFRFRSETIERIFPTQTQSVP